jgi:ABC-2 type transport system permease protein
VRRGVVWALARRDLRRHFDNPTGYVFLALFILLSGVAAFWRPRFFLNNLANLDQLNQIFPYLLALFVPTLTMGVWADERRQGTDELLLTLPVTDVEVVLGKYASVLGMYSAAVLLSISHVLVLMWLGSPDPGVMAGTYLGFWLAGAALIPVGMLASFMTANTTISFVLGALFCAIPIGLPAAAASFSVAAGRRAAPLGMPHYFSPFGQGTVGLAEVLYFTCLAALFLCLNAIVLGRRRSREAPQRRLALHHAARAAALLVLFAALVILASRFGGRLDLTADRMHELSGDTERLLAGLPADRPVVVQAFVSPEVPQSYVEARENLLAVLRGVDDISGGTITVVVEETLPFSPQAQRARDRYGIAPRAVADQFGDGTTEEIYLGVVFTSGPEEQVIPFFERGLAAEYEIVKALRVVTRSSRRRVGVIDGDVRLFGGLNFRTNQPQLPWGIVDELRKQYEVVEITPYSAITEKLDALLVVLPSRLSVNEMALVAEPIRKGTPTLILVDPLPLLDLTLAPAAPMAAQIDPFRQQDPTVRVNYGDVRKLLYDLGVNWVPARVAWDSFNAHPDMTALPAEAVFVTPKNGNADALNRTHAVTRGLQEVLMLYPGHLLPAEPDAFEMQPLLQTGTLSGTTGFFQATRPTPAGPVLAGPVPHQPEGGALTLAAHVRAKAPLVPPNPTNVIVVADLDVISDYFFDVRREAPVNVTFDNITFFLNAIDVLAGDESFISLRNRRVRLRTLDRVEAQTRSFLEQRSHEEQQTRQEAQTALDSARERLKARVKEIEAREDLDDLARQIMIRNLEAAEGRRLQALETAIATERDAKIAGSREAMETRIRRIRSTIRVTAVLLPPVPVIVVGAIMFARRRRRERAGALLAGRLRTAS